MTDKDIAVIHMIAEGMTNQQIAARTFVSDKTIKGRISSIMWEMDAVNRAQIVAIAFRTGLLN